MDKKLKSCLVTTSVLLLFFLALPLGCMAAADVPPSPPILPMTVTGVALINGTPAPDGTVVAAYLDEKEYLANTSSGNYSLFIPGTAEDVGKLVTFKVDGKAASSSVAWESGSMVTLELPDGKAIYSTIAESDSSSGLNSNSNSNSNTNSNSNSNTNSNSNSNSKISSKPLVEDEEQEDSAESSKVDTVESSVPEPNMTALQNTSANSEDYEAVESSESSESSPKPESAPGFLSVYAVAGILLLAFGFNFGRGSRKNP
ncbi:MAG: hypothetical protein ACHQXK_02250 [Methanosarcina thermophila]|jgi:hypothetical protein|uniref:Uncharacterized protein n=4 Tax=Methanosarcina thermophila TaxID=2210 RepID=A0A0E3NC39_METTE|nr:hypothetical protein [Methanosarcina thermophila]AKB11818.1 hypothetical protein MSTHT_0060 [Methanosarcina thermophila TM-1]AKB14988.1 hypothetical protein MSTHC_0670 [Methanosarcina thermophila CHTI-55]SFT70730.1 hypothetical protein SAMN02910340_01923 [Methanosarcina thermophila]HOA67901.1 hypothetical protein [Methanosarcina thermophila]HOQ66615.1 hypothetical protein [Methanosarcina thermophila]